MEFPTTTDVQRSEIDQLQRACVSHMKETLPYTIESYPNDLTETTLSFDGHYLVDHEQQTWSDWTYSEYRYVPLHTLTLEDIATFPRNDMLGEPVPLILWRGMIWRPVAVRTRSLDEETDAKLAPYEEAGWRYSADTHNLIRDFLDRFENVFSGDWEYTQGRVGDENFIYPHGTFLAPHVADESNNWGNRGGLLASYRALKQHLDRAKDNR